MKLYWSSRSPYVRKAMIAAHETGVAARLELVRVVVSTTQREPALVGLTPLGQIPTLVADDGTALYDSLVIAAHFDTLHEGPRLFPPSGPPLVDALRRHAAGDGLLDLLLKRLTERRRPAEQQSAAFIEVFRAKTATALDVLEREVEAFATLPTDIGHVALASALAYLDFRFADEPWRDGRPGLEAWFAAFSARPSMTATAFSDEY